MSAPPRPPPAEPPSPLLQGANRDRLVRALADLLYEREAAAARLAALRSKT
ncbi:MAG: hypothetical protein IPI35_27305 [Deltaproteobacteria bacterium]|jgi:hypothetical protein|nr:hypothetical protein [Deltaproteobacteria bacterium]